MKIASSKHHKLPFSSLSCPLVLVPPEQEGGTKDNKYQGAEVLSQILVCCSITV